MLLFFKPVGFRRNPFLPPLNTEGYVSISVCYLTKFLASMFVCPFVTCQNFEEICNYVRLSIRMFVRYVKQNS